MTIAQAREAAKQVRESLQRLEKLFPSIREGKSNFTIMSDFILDHFPEDGEERVTDAAKPIDSDFLDGVFVKLKNTSERLQSGSVQS